VVYDTVDNDPLDPGEPYETEELEYFNAIDVTSTFNWSQFGITYSKVNDYTVRLTGPAINVFTNQFYKFKMADGTEQILQADTTEPFFSLFQYKMPNPTYTMKTYTFSVTVPPNPLVGGPNIIETVDMKQWLYWRYEVANANIAAAVARGLR
jgi:hypothetical protein